MPASAYLLEKIVDHVFNGVTYPSPTKDGKPLYLGLSTAVVSESNPTWRDELTEPEYKRAKLPRFHVTEGPYDGAQNNAWPFRFPTACSRWPNMNSAGIFDAETGGNLLFFMPVTDPNGGGPLELPGGEWLAIPFNGLHTHYFTAQTGLGGNYPATGFGIKILDHVFNGQEYTPPAGFRVRLYVNDIPVKEYDEVTYTGGWTMGNPTDNKAKITFGPSSDFHAADQWAVMDSDGNFIVYGGSNTGGDPDFEPGDNPEVSANDLVISFEYS